MTVATLRLELLVGNCNSLREKQRRMRAIMTKLHRHFNVSVAEGGLESDPGHALLFVATVSRSRRDVRETFERITDAVAAYPRADLVCHEITEY